MLHRTPPRRSLHHLSCTWFRHVCTRLCQVGRIPDGTYSSIVNTGTYFWKFQVSHDSVTVHHGIPVLRTGIEKIPKYVRVRTSVSFTVYGGTWRYMAVHAKFYHSLWKPDRLSALNTQAVTVWLESLNTQALTVWADDPGPMTHDDHHRTTLSLEVSVTGTASHGTSHGTLTYRDWHLEPCHPLYRSMLRYRSTLKDFDIEVSSISKFNNSISKFNTSILKLPKSFDVEVSLISKLHASILGVNIEVFRYRSVWKGRFSFIQLK